MAKAKTTKNSNCIKLSPHSFGKTLEIQVLRECQMSQVEQLSSEQRAEIRAIRQARRYLLQNDGTLARILNAYKSAAESGTQLGYLPER